MNKAEQIIWAAWKDGQNTADMVQILNRIPELLDGRSHHFTEAEVQRMLNALRDGERRGFIVKRPA